MEVVEYWHGTIKNYRYDRDVSCSHFLKSLERRIEYLGTEGVHIRSKMSESTL